MVFEEGIDVEPATWMDTSNAVFCWGGSCLRIAGKLLVRPNQPVGSEYIVFASDFFASTHLKDRAAMPGCHLQESSGDCIVSFEGLHSGSP